MTKNIRMPFPEDTFVKRQFTYLGEIAHEFYGIPGKYVRSETNEYPDITGGNKKADVVYSVKMDDGSIYMVNLEDETSYVNEKTLKKVYAYKTFIFYKTHLPVISVISTTVPLERCLQEVWISPTDFFKPWIWSLPQEDSWKKLNNMLDKTKKQEEFSNIEGLELINLSRCCMDNQHIAVEETCRILANLNMEDQFVKNELIFCMQCMIHKYAKTDEDIIRLEEMIGLREITKERSIVLDNMKMQGIIIGEERGIEKGIERGIERGRQEGSLEVLKALANDPSSNFTAEDLAKKFGFSVDEILNGK